MILDIKPLSSDANFGAEVVGLTAALLERPEVRQELYDLWVQRGVLVFRGVDGGSRTQVELSRCFGEPERHPLGGDIEGFPELIAIDYDANSGTAYSVDGVGRGGWLPWHSDLVYSAEINHGGILRAIDIPDDGGETGFIDQIAAYETLPERLKSRIEDLQVIYKLDLNAANQKFGRIHEVEVVFISPQMQRVMDTMGPKFGPVLHPMVYRQPETGRKVLNVSPWFAMGIYGMETAEGEALLEEVVSYSVKDNNAYYHRWEKGDMVLWDNWRTLHCAKGVSPDAERRMHRSTIAGDYKLGSSLGPAHAERAMSI